MAIDTREKRASAAALLLPWMVMFPLPDGTIGATDRIQIVGLYSGFEAEAPTPPIVVDPDAPLDTSPAIIVRAYLIDEALLSNPSVAAEWPCYIGFMPDDGVGVQDDCVCLYDTRGILDGRLMSGPYMRHYGLQLKVRSLDYQEGWVKIVEMSRSMDTIMRELVDVGGEQYLINNISRTTAVVALGTERETSRRYFFTANFKALIKMTE